MYKKGILALLALIVVQAHSATFTVVNTNISGAGSLQQAILDANAQSGPDIITFNIPSGGLTISPTAALPAITDPVTIDGSTQPGFTAAPIIELNGANAGAGGMDGLKITTSNCVIRALVINRFTGDGIEITNGGFNTVAGCYIGLSLAGTTDQGNTLNGILVTNSANNTIGGLVASNRNYIAGNNSQGINLGGPGATNNSVLGNVIGLGITNNAVANAANGIFVNAPLATIGGNSAAARNIISGNTGDGIAITTAGTNAVVKGNWIGTDLNGTLDRGNNADGILVNGGGITIGGATLGDGNVISGNNQNGIELNGASATNNSVFGNIIGADISGTYAVGNTVNGVLITTSSRSNIIGGISAAMANLIAFNGQDGISVAAAAANTNNTSRGNSIFSNGGLGIDLGVSGVTANDAGDVDTGANQLQNFPVLSGATNTATAITIAGSLNSRAATTYIIDFYSSIVPSQSGNGEGQTWLGSTNVTTAGDGNVSFTVSFNTAIVGRFITATATDPFGNTSEFSVVATSASAALAQTFTVINTNDSGAGSLRQAINDANAAATMGPDRIEFNIPGSGVQTISVAHPFPDITDRVVIDGYTQPGSVTNTSATAFNGTVLIRIDGISAGANADGLSFTLGTNHLVRGLMITRFSSDGIEMDGPSGLNTIEGCIIGLDSSAVDRGNTNNGINLAGSAGNTIGGFLPGSRNVISGNTSDGVEINGAAATNNLVVGNLIGTDFTGAIARPNTANGVFVTASASGNTIGGTNAAARNVISGNTGAGIALSTAPFTTILGNYIGTDVTGSLDLGNNADGINALTSANAVIGGVAPGAGNLISGNNGDGIEFTGSSSVNGSVLGNFIGTDASGTAAVGNRLNGVLFSSSASGCVIGGISAGARNIIAFNLSDGVSLGSTSSGVSIRGNSIFSNGNSAGDVGIDLNSNGVTPNDTGDSDSGANLLQNFPVLTFASNSLAGTLITGALNSVASRSYSLDFYASVISDGSGFGQGQTYLGSTNVTTDSGGDVSFSVFLTGVNLMGHYVSATATDTNGNTSEFSSNIFAASSLPSQSFVVINTNDSGAGSLRQALTDANSVATSGNIVTFNIPGAGLQTISPATPLPIVANPLTIDGYSQPGSATNSLADGDNAVWNIKIDGNLITSNVSALKFISSGNLIRGLVVTRFRSHGLEFTNSQNNIIEGNLIGLDVDSSFAGNWLDGIYLINSASNRIGGLTPYARNIISGNSNAAVELVNDGSSNNVIQGNYIGTDITGLLNRGNDKYGVYCNFASYNLIGGTAPGARNVVSGTGSRFIGGVLSAPNIGIDGHLTTGIKNVIQGNFIGTDRTGMAVVPVGPSMGAAFPYANQFGVLVNSASNLIGGSIPEARNIISGGFVGIGMIPYAGIPSNQIQGNYIGLDVTGRVGLGNFTTGVAVAGDTLVGGPSDAPGSPPGNVISSNGTRGIAINTFGTNATIQGNLIGTDASGTNLVRNGVMGIQLSLNGYIHIGGLNPGEGNVIAGTGVNSGASGAVQVVAADNTTVLGNYIGTDPTGTLVLSNLAGGVNVQESSDVLIISNVVTHSGANGVSIDLNSTNVSVLANSIYDNGLLGIELGGSGLPGVTPNDPGDADDGGNHLQNFPLLVSATNSCTGIVISGTLSSITNTAFHIEFFANIQCDDSGYGEGKQFIGAVETATDEGGNSSFHAAFSYAIGGRYLTATATDPNGNTSEFSPCFLVPGLLPPTNLVVTTTNDSGPGSLRQAILDANSAVCPMSASISFNIPGPGPFIISPLSPLPGLNGSTTMDGYTQPGAITNTLANGDNAVLKLRLDGANLGANSAGFRFAGDGSAIRGFSITRFRGDGIQFAHGAGNRVEGCFIGLDTDGSTVLGNINSGVACGPEPATGPITATANLVGGLTSGARNVISGNGLGVLLTNTVGNFVQGNFIGVNAGGTLSRGNTNGGVLIIGTSTNNLIGGPMASARNVISANGLPPKSQTDRNGVAILGQSTQQNIIQGNYIGINAVGSASLPNGYCGVIFNNLPGPNFVIGNVVSGQSVGIFSTGASASNQFLANFVGTDATGTAAIPNGAGFDIGGPSGTLIASNLVSGNTQGLMIESPSLNTKILANRIGTDVTGTLPLKNTIGILSFASQVTIGSVGAGNIIAYNSSGIVINAGSATNNFISANSIFSSANYAIDLAADNVTPNDNLDLDGGPNLLQNYPLLSTAKLLGSQLTVTGTLNSRSNSTYRLEFFDNDSCNSTYGHGDGKTYLGFTNVATGSTGDASFTFVTNGLTGPNHIITATATDPNGNTSEFSACLTAVASASPQLSILISGGQLEILWPSLLTGFHVQATTNIAATATWTNVPGLINDDGTNKYIIFSLDPSDPERFFRLITP